MNKKKIYLEILKAKQIQEGVGESRYYQFSKKFFDKQLNVLLITSLNNKQRILLKYLQIE